MIDTLLTAGLVPDVLIRWRIRQLLRHFFDGQCLAGTGWPGQQHDLATPQTFIHQLSLRSDETPEADR